MQDGLTSLVFKGRYGDANERLFLMKYLAAVEVAMGLGAKICEGEVSL